MFYECSNLKEIREFSRIDNIKDMSFTFYGCINLEKLPEKFNFNTKNLTNIKAMFYGCKLLEKVPKINNWNINKVDNVSFMFFGCEKLKEIPEPFSDENKIKNKDTSFMKYEKEFFREIKEEKKEDKNEEKIENKNEEKIENKNEEKIGINYSRKYKSTQDIVRLTKEKIIEGPFWKIKKIMLV